VIKPASKELAMSIIVLKLPDVKVSTAKRPAKCPSCKGEILQRWGGQVRRIRDPQVKEVIVYRYRCAHCRHTFRHYPEGVDQAQQSQRLRKLAAICWAMGLSHRGIAAVFAAFGVGIARMTAWRDVQEEAGKLRQKRIWKPVRVLGVDGVYVRGWGKTHSVLVAVDMGDGKPVAIGMVDERNPQSVRRWLEPLVQRLGVSVIVTDDLASYRNVADKLDLEHQVCQFHLRRWIGRTLHELQEKVPGEWRWVLDEVKRLLQDLPPTGGQRLFELWMQIPKSRTSQHGPLSPLELLRNLLIRMSQHWERYRVFEWQNEVPWTNNLTEQVIGRMKIRSKSVRGYKSEPGLLSALLLTGSGVC
jgi:transposase-like protein